MSLPEIAARAGVASSSLYRRWGTRENLVAEALLERSEVEIPVPDTGTIRTDLIAFATHLARFLSSRRGKAVVRAMAVLEWSEELDAARASFWEERFALAATMVHRAIERGELDPTIDVRLVLETVIAPVHLRASLLGVDPIPRIEQQIDLLLSSLRRTS